MLRQFAASTINDGDAGNAAGFFVGAVIALGVDPLAVEIDRPGTNHLAGGQQRTVIVLKDEGAALWLFVSLDLHEEPPSQRCTCEQ